MADALAERYAVYSCFKQYYQGDWRQAKTAVRLVREYVDAVGDQESSSQVLSGLEILETEVTEESDYAYNRLFVGPAKLVAPPYESCYTNAQGLPMQAETLAVRDFYLRAGLKVRDKNVIPDDHLGLELEFVCFLLSKAGQSLTEGNDPDVERYLGFYHEFFKCHIQNWVHCHCRDILGNSDDRSCRGAALALSAFLRLEEKHLASGEGIRWIKNGH